MSSQYKEAIKQLEKNGMNLRLFQHQDEKMCMVAIQQNPSAYQYAKIKTKKVEKIYGKAKKLEDLSIMEEHRWNSTAIMVLILLYGFISYSFLLYYRILKF